MTEFSIQESAFTGFRIVREHPGFLATWAVLALVMSILFTATSIGLAGQEMARLQQLGATGSHDPAVAIRVLGKLLPVYALLTPAALIFYGVLYSAMNRAVLRPQDTKFAYLAFGADELRQVGLMFQLFVVGLGVYFAAIVAIVVLGLLLARVAGVGPTLLALMSVLGFAAVFTVFAVKFSLASPLTFQTKRVNLFGSWALTRGHFWPILGTYLLTLALACVVMFLTYLVVLAVVAVVTGGNMFALTAASDVSSIHAYFTTSQVVQLVLSAGVSALIWPVMLTPPAAIFRRIAGDAPSTTSARVSA